MKITFATYFYNDFDKRIGFFIEQLKKSLNGNNDYELLLINNGGRKLVIDEVLFSNINYRIVDMPKNLNPGGAKEKIVDEAKGDFLWILDNDDEFSFSAEILFSSQLNEKKVYSVNWSHTHQFTKFKNQINAWTWAFIFPTKLIKENNPFRGWHHWYEEVLLESWFIKNKINIKNDVEKLLDFKYKYINNMSSRIRVIDRSYQECISLYKILCNSSLNNIQVDYKWWVKMNKKRSFEYFMHSKINRKTFLLTKDVIFHSTFIKFVFSSRLYNIVFSLGRFFLHLFNIEKGWYE